MEAGKLRHRVTLQSPYGSRDAVGERVTLWADEATVWADVRPLTSHEQYIFAQQQASTTHLVTVRYSPELAGLTAAWRVKFKQRIFTIDGPPKNLEERNRTIELACTEGLRLE